MVPGTQTLLVNSSQLPQLLAELDAAPNMSLRGILVVRDTITTSNLDSKSPQSSYLPYSKEHAWNPGGMGLLGKRWDFPIQLLDADSASAAAKMAEQNQNKVCHTRRHPFPMLSHPLGTLQIIPDMLVQNKYLARQPNCQKYTNRLICKVLWDFQIASYKQAA